MSKISLSTIAALVALSLSAAPAHALLNRAWVSGHGTDAAGCGAPTSPCRSFQYVHDNIIAPGGEIDALDGADYGAITITKALSIVGDGALAAVQQPNAGQNAITILAGETDAVHLRSHEWYSVRPGAPPRHRELCNTTLRQRRRSLAVARRKQVHDHQHDFVR
jgi:hypothetical protein